MARKRGDSQHASAPNQDSEPSFFPKGHGRVLRTPELRASAVIFYPRNRPVVRQRYNASRLNSGSPYIALEIDLQARPPDEDSGMRRDDLYIGGART
jgi:hypothetical protein